MMKAISLWQPWATWVSLGWKTIETREHDRFKSLIGQRIAIHAAIKVDEDALDSPFFASRAKSSLDMLNLLAFININRGRILCTCQVMDCQWHDPTSPLPWGMSAFQLNRRAMCPTSGKFLIFLGERIPLVHRMPFRGRQGIFNVPDELILS